MSGATPTGYYLKKYCQAAIDLRASTSSADYHTWITFRLGEFYLNYAEAVFKYFELGGNSTAADATDGEFTMSATAAVSMTRDRAKMPGFPIGMANDGFWKSIRTNVWLNWLSKDIVSGMYVAGKKVTSTLRALLR